MKRPGWPGSTKNGQKFSIGSKILRTGRLAEATRRFRNRSRPMVCHSRPKSPPQPRRRSLSSGVYSEGGRMSSRNCGRTQRPGGKDTPQPAPMSGFEGSVRSPGSSAGSVLNGPSFLSPIKSSLVTCRAAMSSGSTRYARMSHAFSSRPISTGRRGKRTWRRSYQPAAGSGSCRPSSGPVRERAPTPGSSSRVPFPRQRHVRWAVTSSRRRCRTATSSE